MFITCHNCPTPYSCTDKDQCMMEDKKTEKELGLLAELFAYESALRLIATPERPDGTFNRDRKSVQMLAEETLKKFNRI